MEEKITKNRDDIAKIYTELGKHDTRIAQVEKELVNLPTAVKEQIALAVELGILKAMESQYQEYKEQSKWKDRTLMGFIISLILIVVSAVVSILRGG